MGRILSLILIAFSAVGNVFSHSHECRLGVGIGERTHVHVHFACGEHSHAAPSHCHEHTSEAGKLLSLEDNTNQREATSQDRPTELGISCGCAAHCSDCDHVIWFPELNRLLPDSKASLQSVILQVFLEERVAAPRNLSLQTRSSWDRFCSRYAEPIYLRHSTLLL